MQILIELDDHPQPDDGLDISPLTEEQTAFAAGVMQVVNAATALRGFQRITIS
jgi:hypothetical protein